MNLAIFDFEQGSEDWYRCRLGVATASRFKDILATIKSGEAASRRNYRAQLVVERLTSKPQETYQNAAMQWGTETEPFARIAYEAHTGHLVGETGFIRHETLSAGCSPDGLIGDDGGMEIKCPHQSAVHIDTLLCGIPLEHIPQIQGALWLTGRKWWDFVSFDPRMPETLQLYIMRIYRDEEYIQRLEAEVRKFLLEVEATCSRLLKIAKAA